jgi:hypothetical protein
MFLKRGEDRIRRWNQEVVEALLSLDHHEKPKLTTIEVYLSADVSALAEDAQLRYFRALFWEAW